MIFFKRLSFVDHPPDDTVIISISILSNISLLNFPTSIYLNHLSVKLERAPVY